MSNYDFAQADCETILSQIKHEEKQLTLKRRWLMGLSTFESEEKDTEDLDILNNKYLPESLLREDDIFYETVKTRVKKALGAYDAEKGHQLVLVDTPLSTTNIRRVLLSWLDAFTNKGLYRLAIILTQGSVNFDKIRWRMKKVIKESLPKVIGMNVFKQLSQLLSDPQNFRDNGPSFVTLASQSLQDAAAKALAGLEKLSTQALFAMHRKLTGVQGGNPRLSSHACGLKRDFLVAQVRKTGENMLSKLDVGDKLQEPLAKALAVAGLSLKLLPADQTSSLMEFHQFSPETQTLQNEIVNAISGLEDESKVRFQELKTLQVILDPNAEVPKKKGLRTAIRKMLTEYLFECTDMDIIPIPLLEALAVINKKSRNMRPKCFPEEVTEQEVECILNVSAQTKQIVLDLLADYEFDKDFADACMEDLVESEDDDDDTDGHQFEFRNSSSGNVAHSIHSNYYEESIGESKPNGYEPEYFTDVDSVGPYSIASSSLIQESMSKSGTFKANENLITPIGKLNGTSMERCKSEYDTGTDPASPPNLLLSNLSCGDQKWILNHESTSKNQYLDIQKTCDKTTIVAYDFIGLMLEEFAEREGLDLDSTDTLYLRGHYSVKEDYQERKQTSSQEDEGSVIARIVDELIPSLPKSRVERLKELMSL